MTTEQWEHVASFLPFSQGVERPPSRFPGNLHDCREHLQGSRDIPKGSQEASQGSCESRAGQSSYASRYFEQNLLNFTHWFALACFSEILRTGFVSNGFTAGKRNDILGILLRTWVDDLREQSKLGVWKAFTDEAFALAKQHATGKALYGKGTKNIIGQTLPAFLLFFAW